MTDEPVTDEPETIDTNPKVVTNIKDLDLDTDVIDLSAYDDYEKPFWLLAAKIKLLGLRVSALEEKITI